MRKALRLRAASTACAATIALVLAATAGMASAQPTFTSGDWGAPDGGVVVIKANGTYELAITDESNDKSIFSEGKVVDKKPTADGKLALTLKPTVGGGTFVVEVAADGSAELFIVDGGGRHKAASLSK